MSKWTQFVGVWAACLLMSFQASAYMQKNVKLVGSNENEKVILYKNVDSKILIKECVADSITNDGDDCDLKPGTSVIKVSVPAFNKRLNRILKLLAGHYHYSNATKEKLESFQNREQNNLFISSKNTKLKYEFNILRSYLQTPGLSESFEKIKAGTFMMGSPLNETGRDTSEIQHTVKLTKDFQIQTTEVTQLQYFLVMNHNPAHFKNQKNCKDEYIVINNISLCPNNPVEQVSWIDVQKFIKRLNESSDSYEYRLPTEAEWEYAARATTTTRFNLGKDISPDVVNYNGEYYPSHRTSEVVYRKQTVPVASLPNANIWGLYDMHGNVTEWVNDRHTWDNEYGHPESVRIDPTGSSSGLNRINRGGSWYDFQPFRLRSASRSFWPADALSKRLGFRLAREGLSLQYRGHKKQSKQCH